MAPTLGWILWQFVDEIHPLPTFPSPIEILEFVVTSTRTDPLARLIERVCAVIVLPGKCEETRRGDSFEAATVRRSPGCEVSGGTVTDNTHRCRLE